MDSSSESKKEMGRNSMIKWFQCFHNVKLPAYVSLIHKHNKSYDRTEIVQSMHISTSLAWTQRIITLVVVLLLLLLYFLIFLFFSAASVFFSIPWICSLLRFCVAFVNFIALIFENRFFCIGLSPSSNHYAEISWFNEPTNG